MLLFIHCLQIENSTTQQPRYGSIWSDNSIIGFKHLSSICLSLHRLESLSDALLSSVIILTFDTAREYLLSVLEWTSGVENL